MKPQDSAIAGNYTISRTQRIAGQKHLCRFDAPALFIVGINVAVPPNRIFQPFFLRKTEGSFNLRANIGLADAAIEMSLRNTIAREDVVP